MKSKIIKVLIGLVVIVAAYLGYTYKQALDTPAPIYNITFNNEEYIASSTRYLVEYWGGTIEKEESIFLVNPVSTNDCNNSLIILGEVTDITESDDYAFTDNQIIFYKSGEFNIDIHVRYEDNTECIYRMIFTVDLIPEIEISNLQPIQGELVSIEISNILIDDELVVDCEFKPSFIERYETQALFYIPVNYKYNAETYPLDITINESYYSYTLDVKAYEFTEVHFTVSESVTNSTTGNPDAGPEYRSLIWPLYDSFSEEIYWDGSMIKPVEENRISSGFGQYRYINNSTYPSRHSGIDYSADCGTEIVAAASGKVDIAYNLILSGNTVVIDHGLGLKSYYFHMDDLEVETGDLVEMGDLIGHVGTTGYSTGCHLHFQVSIKNQPVNPEFLYE